MRVEKKMIVIPALIMIMLSMTGVAVTQWSDGIYVEGTVKTGNLTLAFDWYEPPLCTEFHQECLGGPLLQGELYGKDIGKTTCNCQEVITDPHTGNRGYGNIILTIENAYPSYRVHVTFIVHNIGQIPVDISGFAITDPTGALTWENNKGALVDDSGKLIIGITHVAPVDEQINPDDKVKSEFDFDIKYDAQEGYTYSFEIAIVYTQWGQTMASAQQTLEVGEGKPYATIQAAIDNAIPNENILVYPGTYKEDVTVDVENLTLIGVGGPRSTVLDASGCEFGFSVQAAGATIDNFAVMNANGCGIEVYGENIEGGSVTIQNNVLNNNWRGIFFDNTILNSTVTIENNSISNNDEKGISFNSSIGNSEVGITGNTIDSNGKDGISFNSSIENSKVGITGNTIDNNNGCTGITWRVIRDSHILMENNSISNNRWGIYSYDIVNSEVGITWNTIDNNGDQGIHFNSSIENSKVGITGNTVDSNGHHGIYFVGEVIENSVVGIAGNTVDNNGLQGIYFRSNIENSVVGIAGNTVDNNGYTGIAWYIIRDSHVLIENNSISNNDEKGIHFVSSIENSVVGIAGNTVDNNGEEGIHINAGVDATRIEVNNNNIMNNIAYGVNNKGTGILNAENNWWGDPSGPRNPDTNPSATGDNVSDHVKYEPWRDEPYPTGW